MRHAVIHPTIRTCRLSVSPYHPQGVGVQHIQIKHSKNKGSDVRVDYRPTDTNQKIR